MLLIQSFPSPTLVAIRRLKSSVCHAIYPKLKREKSWIHNFFKGIIAMWKANSLVQDEITIPPRGPFSQRPLYQTISLTLNLSDSSIASICYYHCVLGMTVKCIWWWGFSPGDWRNVEYSFIAITPKSTLAWSDSNLLGSHLWVKRNCLTI